MNTLTNDDSDSTGAFVQYNHIHRLFAFRIYDRNLFVIHGIDIKAIRACEKEFHANSFEEIAEMSKQHGMEMFQKKDEAHLKAMNDMQELMQKPEAMKDWFENKKKEFEALPDD